MINISSFNSKRKLQGILNDQDEHKQLSTQCCVNVGPASHYWTLILNKRWITLIVILIMQ